MYAGSRLFALENALRDSPRGEARASTSRRAWLAAAARYAAVVGATGFSSTTALAIGESSEVSAGQIRNAGESGHRAAALSRLFWDAQKRTAINFASSPVPVDFDSTSDKLFRQPLLSWSGENDFAPLSDGARQRLSRHLRYGGMLWVDAPSAGSGFATGVLRELDAIFPTSPLEPLSKDHVLFKSFFLIKRAVGRTTERGDGGDTGVLAVSVSGRAVVLMTV